MVSGAKIWRKNKVRIRTRGHRFISGPDLELVEVCLIVVAFIAWGCKEKINLTFHQAKDSLTHSRISMFPHFVSAQDVVDLLPYEPCSGCHLHGVIVRAKQVLECTTHLFGDWELVGAGVACPFIVACLRGYDKDVCAIGTEEHHDKSYSSFFRWPEHQEIISLILSTWQQP
jgi:hypothetical protein